VVPSFSYGTPTAADHHTTKLIQDGRECVHGHVRGTTLRAVAAALGLVLSACGSHVAPATHAASTGTHAGRTRSTVTISGYAYTPARLSVAPGTRITFINHDQTPHTATSTHSGFDTGSIRPGRSATITITKPGRYTYYCQFHAFMHGTITVP